MVGAHIAVKAAVVIGAHDFQNAHVAVAVAVRYFGKVAARVVFYVTHVRKGDAVAVGANDIGHVVIGVGAQRAGAQTQTVVGIVNHGEEPADGGFVYQKTRQAKNIPRGIVLMNGHFYAGFVAGGHNGFQEIPEIVPEHFLGDRTIRRKKFF